jgi:signal transduction histidine kinase
MTRLARLLFGMTVVLELAAIGLSWGLEPYGDTLLYAVYAVGMAGAGMLIAERHPRNAIGRLFLGFAVLNALTSDAAQGWALRGAVMGWSGVAVAEWVVAASWLFSGYGLTLTFVLFPDGHLPGRRWRGVPWAGAVGLGLALPGWVLSPERATEFSSGRNPFAVSWLPTAAMLAVGMVFFLGALVAAAVSVVLRYRRSRGVEHQQLKWFTFAAVVAGVALPLSFALWNVTPLAGLMAAVALTGIPVAACVAILRHRLYDIDVIVNRTAVYAVVTVLLAAAYGVTALLLGTTLGQGSVWVTAGATLVVAIAFRPVRDKVQDLVNRRFQRARYQAVHRMTEFLDAVRAGAADPQDVQRVLRELTGDPTLDLLVHLPESGVYVDLAGAPSPSDDREEMPLERGGHPLGVIRHRRGDPADTATLRSLVAVGGLAIEIVRLNVEVRRQLAEVRASRARIVTAANEERRRLERDLHDGAQQRLVAIGLALRHAQHQLTVAGVDVGRATLDDAVEQVQMALDELRELARGLPPAQLDAGLAPAFRDLARRTAVPVQVDVENERYDRGVEGAAYFVGCEGLTNAVKHAGATRIVLRARRREGRLVVTVTDDGIGGATAVPGSGLRGLTDRVSALGGILRVESPPGVGTTLTAELPCGS